MKFLTRKLITPADLNPRGTLHGGQLLKWIDEEFIPKELAGHPELQKIAKNLIMAIETPDAREPQHAGLFLLWKNKQIYTAIKMIRKELKTDRVWMLADFEHTHRVEATCVDIDSEALQYE